MQTEIRLDDEDVIEYTINDKTILVVRENTETIVRIPRTNYASLWKWPDRARITAGKVSISGPRAKIMELWERMVD